MRIAMLLSGGVDSSVALKLLKDQGHEVVAFYLKIWLEDELSYLGDCPWQEDLHYAQAVCKQLDVPLQVIPLQKEYWDRIVTYTIAQAREGKTPNPDVLCNQRIKFGAFLDAIDDSFDKIASGHYARLEEENGTVMLKQAPDAVKDQTYFLSHLSQAQLSRLLFPLANLDKKKVRTLAHRFNLPTKDRKDSQGICFLGKIRFDQFLKHHLGERPGDLIEMETNEKVGTHKGFWFYTIGQRRGLGLAGGPWYVVDKDIKKNNVYISRHYYAGDKYRKAFIVGHCNWVSGNAPQNNAVGVKMRHGAHMHTATIKPLACDRFKVQLAEHDQGIAAGQFAVFYDGDRCLGSGVIQEAIWQDYIA